MFIRKIIKRRRGLSTTDRIRTVILIDNERGRYLEGEITFRHCRGHDTITVLFSIKGFHESHVRLLSENYYFR